MCLWVLSFYSWTLCTVLASNPTTHLSNPFEANRVHCVHSFNTICVLLLLFVKRRDAAQAVDHSAVNGWILLPDRSILHGRCICTLGYFSFQPVLHNWPIKSGGMWCPICGKVHIKDPLLLIRKSSLCGDSRLPLKNYVTMTICLTSYSRWYEKQCVLEASLNNTNFPFLLFVDINAGISRSLIAKFSI